MTTKATIQIFNRNETGVLEEACSLLLLYCNQMSLKEGKSVHSSIIKLGLHQNLYLNNNLLSLYSKCDGPHKARKLFDEMPHRDVVSWTGMLSSYTKNKNHDLALQMFGTMVNSGQYPNEFTISSVLRSCAALGELNYGARVQGYLIKCGFGCNPVLCSSLIDLYSKFGETEEAFKLFNCIENGDTVSWTVMISSLVQAQKWRQAFVLYADMIQASVPPNEFTFVKLLAAAAFLGLKIGKLVHANLIVWGIKLNLVLKTAIVDMYSRLKRMEDAITVSNLTPQFDVYLWTAIISGFNHDSKFREGLEAFHQMQKKGVRPNNYTYSCVLNACLLVNSSEVGKQIHSHIIKVGFENDASVGNSLIDMYMKCFHKLADGLRVFKGITAPNTISWTSLIAGFADNGFEQDSYNLFTEMRMAGVEPNSFTISTILRACSSIKSLKQTLVMHGYLIKTKKDKDIVVGNSLVDAYAGVGLVDDAWRVISMMDQRDIITYTGLATRINQMGHHDKALNIVNDIYSDGVRLDGFSIACFLSAGASLGTLETGKQLHCYSLKSGLTGSLSPSSSIVDFYGKCGSMHDLRRAFEEITNPDVFSWNALISGMASHGFISSSLSAFDDMRLAGVKPDSVTFLSLLFACTRGGLVDLGLDYFRSMREEHNIIPQIDHYVRLVDLLGRAGRLEEAVGVMENMPFRPTARIYKSLLCSCRLHRNISLGEEIARRGFELDALDSALYVLLATLYDDCGRSDLSEKTLRLMKERGLKKSSAQSWVEIQNKLHNFVSGDKGHEEITEIHKTLEALERELTKQGYAHRDNGDGAYHSAKLAVAFGILKMPSGAPIRIITNKHICRDCSDFLALVSRLHNREITVKAGNQNHSFRQGEFCDNREITVKDGNQNHSFRQREFCLL